MSHCTTFAEAGRLVDAGRRAPFLLTLCEEDENELHITICCAKAEPNAQTPSTGNAALDDILAHCTPLCPDENAKIELIFENYLLYQVRNESYCVFDADEVRGGTYLCTFERSKLLDYLPRAIDVQLIPDGTDAPASWKHYVTRRIRSSTSLPRPSPRCARPFDVHAHILCQQMFYSIRQPKRKSPCLVTRAF